MTDVAKTKKDDIGELAADAPRKAPEIDPNNVTVNSTGASFQSYFVRAPSGLIADDLKEPGIWRKVQNSPRVSLRKFDDLRIIAFDETWVADAIVAEADSTQVVLAKPRITQIPPRTTNLFQDDRYRIKWQGVGYVVERKADGHRMTEPVHSVALAERDLRNLYPRIVG